MKIKRIRFLLVAFSVLAVIATVIAIPTIAANSTQPLVVDFEIAGQNLAFEENIYVKYVVMPNEAFPTDVKPELLVWREPKASLDDYVKGSGERTISAVKETVQGTENCYTFTYNGISIKQMTDDVYARAYYKDSEGTEHYSKVKKYSILQYAYNKLGNIAGADATDNQTLKDLLVGMLDFGAAAQNYFDYATERLASATDFVQVKVEGGTLPDGFTEGLYKSGTPVTLTAPASNTEGDDFSSWTDTNGSSVGKTNSIELTVNKPSGSYTVKYTANYFVYSSLQRVEGAGDSLAVGSYALTEHTPAGVAAGSSKTISSDYNGGGETINAPEGVTISGNGITVENVVIVGPVTINANNVTLKNVDIQGIDAAYANAAVTVSGTGVTIDDCRITTSVDGVVITGDDTTVKNSYIKANIGVDSDADGTSVLGNRILANNYGITSKGIDLAANNNTITTSKVGVGIAVEGESHNSLVSYNVIEGAKSSIKVCKAALNSSVLFNSAYDIVADGSVNTYIVKNAIGGSLALTDNNYLICDDNTSPGGKVTYKAIDVSNINYNGNNITDVNSRAEVGAKEELLPHTNKDLFINMEKKTTVKGTSQSLDAYIEANAVNGGVVIVPPGYYTLGAESADMISLDGMTYNGAVIYAYGVFGEKSFNSTTNNNNRILNFASVSNVTVNGLTLGYNTASSGQIHVLSVDKENNQITAVSGAGFDDSFSKGNLERFSSSIPIFVIDGKHVGGANISTISANEGILTIIFEESSSLSTYLGALEPGDIMYCRLKGDNAHSINFSETKGAKLKDVTFYGYTAGMAFVATEGTEGVALERVHNTSRSAAIIEKETYDRYEEYDLTGLVYIDENGNWRGSTPVVGSVDGMHSTRTDKGFTVVSSTFENMCDDGGNHRGSSYRIYSYTEDSDSVSFTIVARSSADIEGRFSAGDTAYIYNANGKVIFKGEVSAYNAGETVHDDDSIVLYSCVITVQKNNTENYLDLTPLSGWRFSTLAEEGNEVIADNLSRNADTSLYDNVLFQSTMANGARVRNNNATIKNCTFRNIAENAILISSEGRQWKESTMPNNVQVLDCLFENTGYKGMYTNDAALSYVPILVSGSYLSNTQLYTGAGLPTGDALGNRLVNDVVISGCEFRDYSTMKYLIRLISADDVEVTDNVFTNYGATTKNYIYIYNSKTVKVDGNKDGSTAISGSSLSIDTNSSVIFGSNAPNGWNSTPSDKIDVEFDLSATTATPANADVLKDQIDEDGTTYTRFSSSSENHANFSANGNQIYFVKSGTSVYNTGKYLILKWRVVENDFKETADGTSTKRNINLRVSGGSSNDTSTTYSTRAAGVMSHGEWVTEVIDLNGHSAYTTMMKDGKVYLRLLVSGSATNTGKIIIDIATAALVDSVSDVKKYLNDDESYYVSSFVEEGNWTLGTRYMKSGEIYDDVVRFNKDLEPLVKDKKGNELQFIHFSDIHRGLNAWNRVVQYYNEYSEYIDFAVHSGDYVGEYNFDGENGYVDLYTKGTKSINPIYNVVGNHDVYAVKGGATHHEKSKVISTLFNKTDDWDVSYMGGTAVNTSYYRDFPEQNVRFIVLDNYYDEEGQAEWLQGLLDEAKNKGYHVLTSMHEPTAKIVTPVDTSFHCNIEQTSAFRTSAFDKVLGDFIKGGGNFIANLTGHWHVDFAGYTENGVLNLTIEIASPGAVGAEQLDGRPQNPGVRGYDAFNVINVNTEKGIFEIVRIGNNSDAKEREKTSLEYDYINGRVNLENGILK